MGKPDWQCSVRRAEFDLRTRGRSTEQHLLCIEGEGGGQGEGEGRGRGGRSRGRGRKGAGNNTPGAAYFKLTYARYFFLLTDRQTYRRMDGRERTARLNADAC